MRFDNLKKLHYNMREKEQLQTIFKFKYNSKSFSCIFDVAKIPYSLYLTTCQANPITFDINVKNGYLVEDKFDSKDYKYLCKYLELKYDPDNPFRPQYFLQELNKDIPSKGERVTKYHELVAAASHIRGRNIEESEKIYFLKWRHNFDGAKVSHKNLEKTLIAFGTKIKEMSESRNISSCWTDLESDQNMVAFEKINNE